MTACRCPAPPSFELREAVPAGPITCSCCGKPLELTCPGCGPSSVDASIAAAFPVKPERVKPERVKQPRTYAMKPCVRCAQPFQPTGPRSTTCEKCKAAPEAPAYGV